MIRFKYIVVQIKYPNGGDTIDYCKLPGPCAQELAVIFTPTLTHREMLEMTLRNRDIRGNEPSLVSAGFVNIEVDKIYCSGESLSIKEAGYKSGYKSRGKVDAKLLADFQTTQGLVELK